MLPRTPQNRTRIDDFNIHCAIKTASQVLWRIDDNVEQVTEVRCPAKKFSTSPLCGATGHRYDAKSDLVLQHLQLIECDLQCNAVRKLSTRQSCRSTNDRWYAIDDKPFSNAVKHLSGAVSPTPEKKLQAEHQVFSGCRA
jgi:hypothetical protein